MKIRKIYNEIQLIWNDKTNSFDTLYEDSYSHDGEIYEMAKSEVDLSGADTAAALLKKISKAAKRVTKEFDGWSKASKENADVLKILAKNSKGAEGSIEDLVKAYKGQIEAMLKVKAITKAEKQLGEQDKKIKQERAQRETIDLQNYKKANQERIALLQAHGQALTMNESIDKASAQTRKRVSAQLTGLNSKLKKHNVGLKDVTQGTNLAARAMRGEAKALQEIKRRTEEVIKTGKLNGKQLKLFETRSNRNSMSLSRLRSQLLMVAFAFGMMKKLVSFATEAYMKQEKAEAMVTSALKATSGAVGLSNKAIYKHAAALQQATGVGDEMILSSSALLLTFRKIGGNEFKQAQSSIVDLTLALNQGTISEEKMKSSTIMLGKALNDPIQGMTALSRAGVTFSESQKQQIRTFMELGEVEKAQGVILQELEKQVGGLGEAFGNTLEGKVMAMKSAFSDLQETLGAVLIPVIKTVITLLSALIKLFGNKHTWLFIAALTAAAARTYMLAEGLKAATIWQNFYAAATVKATAATARLTFAINTLKRATVILIVFEILFRAIEGMRTKNLDHLTDGFSFMGLQLIKKHTKALTLMTEAEQELHDAAMQREQDIESNIYALEKELRVLEAKTEIEKWIIQQEKMKEGVIYEVTSAEIKLKESIISLNASLEDQKELEKEILQIRKDLATSSLELADAELLYGAALLKNMALQGAGWAGAIGFDKDLVEEFNKDEANQLASLDRLVKIQQRRNKAIRDIANIEDLGIKASFVNGQLVADTEDYIDLIKQQVDIIKQKYGVDIDTLDLMEANIILSKDKDDAAKKEINRQKEIRDLQLELANEILGDIGRQIEVKAKLLDAEMNADVARMKKSGAYKHAQKQGDDKRMQVLEEKARKKTLPSRIKAFREKQHVSAAEVALHTAVAMTRANADYPWPASMPIIALLAALSTIQLGVIYAARPPKYAKGGDFTTSGPQTIQVGDNPGGRERVQITPLSSPNVNGPQGSRNITVNFSGNVLSQDFIEEQAIPQIKEAIRRGADIGIS